jgi:hypothetical protein
MKIFQKTILCFMMFCTGHSVYGFEAGEHALIGDFAFKKVLPNVKNSFSRLEGNGSFSYGYLVAMSGDLYKDIEELVLDDAKILKKPFKRNQTKIKECFKKEIDSIEKEGSPYTRCKEEELAIHKARYVSLAHDNYEHFSWHNLKEYIKHHKKALWFAKLTYWKCSVEKREENKDECEKHKEKIKSVVNKSSYKQNLPFKNRELPETFRRRKLTKDYLIKMSEDEMKRLAIYANAFADHFLTDSFSAGHLRVPRSQIDTYAKDRKSLQCDDIFNKRTKGSIVSGALSQYLHNLDGNRTGIHVKNSKGDYFIVRSDKQLFAKDNDKLMMGNPEHQTNVKNPIEAVKISLDELFQVIKLGPQEEPSGVYKALELVPFVDSSKSETLQEVVQNHIKKNKGSLKDARKIIGPAVRKAYKGAMRIYKNGSPDSIFKEFSDNIDILMCKFQKEINEDLKDPELKKRIPSPLQDAMLKIQ